MNALDLANSFRERRGRIADALDPELGLHRLRDTIRALFINAATGSEPSRGSVELLNQLAEAPRLRWGKAGPSLGDESAATAAARTAIELLASGRVRQCGNPRCVRFYLADGGRAFCSSTCGNRTRVARHAARRR